MNKKQKIKLFSILTLSPLAFLISCTAINKNTNNQTKEENKTEDKTLESDKQQKPSNVDDSNLNNNDDNKKDSNLVEDKKTNNLEDQLNKKEENVENKKEDVIEKNQNNNFITLSNLTKNIDTNNKLSVVLDVNLNNQTINDEVIKLELIDNNKNTYISQPSKISLNNNSIVFDFDNIKKNREYKINKIITDKNQKIKIDNTNSLVINPSKTYIDSNSFFVDNLTENDVKIGFLIKTEDNIFDSSNELEIKLVLGYLEQNETKHKTVFIKTNSYGNRLFVRSTIFGLLENTEYNLISAEFTNKPSSLFINVNDDQNNMFYKNTEQKYSFKFNTTSKNSMLGKINLNDNNIDLIHSAQTNVRLSIDDLHLNHKTVDLNNINNDIKLVFKKTNLQNKTEEVLGVNLDYIKENKTLNFEINNFDWNSEYELKQILVKETNLLINKKNWNEADISKANKIINFDNYLNDKFLLNSNNIEVIEELNNANVLTLNFNNLSTNDLESVINILGSNSQLNSNHLFIKNHLIKIIDKYFVLNENNNFFIKLKSNESTNEPLENTYLFTKNNISLIDNNETTNSNKFKVRNAKNEEILVTKNPYLDNNAQGIVVENDFFITKRLSSKTLFAHNEENAHSYRIPSVIKTKSNTLIANADKRHDNWSDYHNNITQVIKKSIDNGKSWSNNKEIVAVKIPKHNNAGIAMDGVIGEVSYSEDDVVKNKLIFAFDLFPGKIGIPHLLTGNPWVLINGQSYLKMWTKINNPNNFDNRLSVLKKVGKSNWFRRYILPSNNFNVNESDLTVTNTYVDLNYNEATRTITGLVYENIENESDLLNNINIESKKTNNSVLDQTQEKYVLAKSSHIVTLESYDEGESWTNLNWIESNFVNTRGNLDFLGTAIGNIIQLKNQTDPLLNNRIIMPIYGRNTNKTWLISYLYSDDYGNNWNYAGHIRNFNSSTESSMFESEDGTIYWMTRVDKGNYVPTKFNIAKSTDGAKTWTNLIDNSDTIHQININNKQYDANVFSGLSSFAFKNKRYFVFAAAIFKRKNGSLYISDENFENIIEIFKFNNTGNIPFSYSYPIITNIDDEGIELNILYETPQRHKYNDLNNNSMEEIQIDRFKIKFKS